MAYVLTDTTVELLKNIAAINPEAMFKAGHEQRACNGSRNFIADVEFADPLPTDCAIYELNRLIGILETCKSGDTWPSIEFGESSLTAIHDHGRVTIPYAHKDVIAKPPTQTFHLASPTASFSLPHSLWSKIIRTASVLQSTAMHIIIDNAGTMTLKLVNEKSGNPGGSASYDMPDTVVTNPTPNVWSVKFDALKLLPGDYTVNVGEVGTSAHAQTLFGMFFKLNDPVKKVSYLTSGTVVKTR